jgi:hypothetical protein
MNSENFVHALQCPETCQCLLEVIHMSGWLQLLAPEGIDSNQTQLISLYKILESSMYLCIYVYNIYIKLYSI